MPIYHFHDANGSRHVDSDGIDLPNENVARQSAVRFAAEMLRDRPDKLWNDGQWRVEVTNDDNVLLFTVITLAIDAPRPEEE